MTERKIWFDMDGTIADLYGVNGWLADLLAHNPRPYAEARPLVNMQVLARRLNKLRAAGYEINIISWLSKGSTAEYDEAVAEAKKVWLKTHLKSVKFTHIDIVKYGTPKQIGRNGILFDDEELNRKSWNGVAFGVDNILNELKAL